MIRSYTYAGYKKMSVLSTKTCDLEVFCFFKQYNYENDVFSNHFITDDET